MEAMSEGINERRNVELVMNVAKVFQHASPSRTATLIEGGLRLGGSGTFHFSFQPDETGICWQSRSPKGYFSVMFLNFNPKIE